MTFKNTLIQWRRGYILSATFFCMLVAIVSCKKTESGLGANDYDGLLSSNGVDTFSINTYTILEDSVYTKNPTFALLGSYRDPVFGAVDANFYTQLRLQTLNPNFNASSGSFVIDSVVLGLEHRIVNDLDYKAYYGKPSAQKVEVFRLTDSLNADSTYFAFSTTPHESENLVVPGKDVLTMNTLSKTVVGKDTLNPQLRIHLKPSFGMALVAEAENNPASYSGNDNFLRFFKGLHVRVNNGSQSSGFGQVNYFNLNATNSKMTLYFRQGTDTLRYDYIINSSCTQYNHVDVDDAGTSVNQVIANHALGNNQYYAQAFRSRAVVEFPSVSDIPVNSVIQRAELIIPVAYQSGKIYYPSEVISVATKISNDSEKLYDTGVLGVYDESQKAYVLDMRTYIQNVVKKSIENRGLILSTFFINSSVERIIFNGKNADQKKKPKLVVTYTSY